MKTKKWLKKTIILHAVFWVFGIIYGIYIFSVVSLPSSWAYLLVIPLSLWVCTAYSSLFLYFKQTMKFIFTAAKVGYKVGEQMQTTHINVNHTYGNNYEVSSYTEHHGIFGAIITGFIGFYFLIMFCAFIAPFCNYKKARAAIKALRSYQLDSEA